jgi:hypothetical protein
MTFYAGQCFRLSYLRSTFRIFLPIHKSVGRRNMSHQVSSTDREFYSTSSLQQLVGNVSNDLIFNGVFVRDLIEVGVNVTASRKKESLRSVRVSKRSGPVRPGSSYNVYRFELRDRCCVSLIIPPKSRLAEIRDFGTQV